MRTWADALLNPSPLAMRRIALIGVVTSTAIIWTGGAVRLSQSGLGCTDWPKCTATSLVASGVSGAPLFHRWVEFGNRLVTDAIFVVAILVFVAAWQFRDSATGARRRDLVWLAAAQPAGIAVQAIVGGIVVLTHLAPFWVSLHFIATLPVLAAAVALYVRCTEGTGPPKLLVKPVVRFAARALLVVTSVMMVAGTLVTGTGPLSGSDNVHRFRFLTLVQITQLHADVGWVLGTVAVMFVVLAVYEQAPDRVIRLAWITLGLIAAQGVLGYVQYWLHLPAGLVWIHVANTALIWIAVLRLNFALRDRGRVGVSVAGPDLPAAAAEALSGGTGLR
jgi:heme A synthase